MAGNKLERLVTQARVFFGVSVPKHLGCNSPQGRQKGLTYVIGLLMIVVFLVVLASGEDELEAGQVGVRNTYQASRSVVSDEIETDGFEDETDQPLLVHGDDEEDDEDGAEEDTDAETDTEGTEAEQVSSLKSEQQGRQAQLKGDFAKFFESNHHQEEIRDFIQTYVDTYTPVGILRKDTVAQTYDKRTIYSYTLGSKTAKKRALVLGSDHGCEWSVPMYLTYVITRLAQLYGINDEVTEVLDSVKITVIPYVNPDGAAYTVESKSHDARYYYKNRAPYKKHSSSKGVDLREAWNSKSGSSQAEIASIKALVDKLKPAALLSVQCCSSGVVAPRNATCVAPSAIEEQLSVGKSIADEMNIANKFSFAVVPQPKSRHSSSDSDGTVTHWAQNVAGINLAFTLSAAPSEPESASSSKKASSKHKSSSSNKSFEVADKDLLTSSREVTKGIVAVGKYLSASGPRPRSALCGDPIGETDEEPLELDEDDDSAEHSSGQGGEQGEDDQAQGDKKGTDAYGEMEPSPEDRRTSEKKASLNSGAVSNALRFAAGLFRASPSSSSSSTGRAVETASISEDSARTSLRFAQGVQSEGVDAPILKHLEQSTLDGTDPVHFLYFAYNADLLADLLFDAGVTSAVKVVNAQLDGYGMDFTYYSKRAWRSGVADLYKLKRGHVQGVVYRVDKSQRELLDRHNLAASEDSHIKPLEVVVTDKLGHMYPAMTYYAPLKTSGLDVNARYHRFRPSRQYRACMVLGATAQGISEEYIDRRVRAHGTLIEEPKSSSHRNERIGNLCD